MNRSWRLVARPESSTSRPVANGSSVPAWPVFAPVRRRTRATIANDDGPAGLSTRITPVGSSAFGIAISRGRSPFAASERVDDPPGDLVHREVGREARRPLVPPAAEAARDRGDVDAVRMRAQRPLARRRRASGSSRTSATSSAPSTARRWSMMPSEYGSSAPAASKSSRRSSETTTRPSASSRRALERAGEQLELRERRRLVDLDEHLADVRAGLDELGREPERLRRRVRVLEPPRVGDERRVERLGDRRRRLDAEPREDVGEHLAGRRRVRRRRGRRAPKRVLSWWWSMLTSGARPRRGVGSTMRLSCAQSTATSTRSPTSAGALTQQPVRLELEKRVLVREAARRRPAPSRSPSRAASSARCVASSEPSASPSGLSCDVTTKRSWRAAPRRPRSCHSAASSSPSAGASSSIRCVIRTPCSTARS